MSLSGSRLGRGALRAITATIVGLLPALTLANPAEAIQLLDDERKHRIVVTTTLAAVGVTPKARITVLTGTAVTDEATISGIDAKSAGRIRYLVFSDPSCRQLIFDATPVANSFKGGSAPASKTFTSATAGVFYWQAIYHSAKRKQGHDGDADDKDRDKAKEGGALNQVAVRSHEGDGDRDDENDEDDNDRKGDVISTACGDEQLTVVEPGHLLVKKHVINDNGGNKIAADFTVLVTGGAPSQARFSGSESGVDIVFRNLSPPSYSVDEIAVEGYAKTLSTDCSGTIAVNQRKTCTITNDDIPATSTGRLTVIKHVVNDNGGTKTAAEFTITVTSNGAALPSFAGSESGTDQTVSAGSYSVAEAATAGYDSTVSAGCAGTIAQGETRTCTITNNDQPAHLVVIKHVVNDNGGTKTAADFTMTVTGSGVSAGSFPGAESPGTNVTLNAGTYAVDEAAVAGYAKTRAASCTGTIGVGETKTCTITNDDVAPLAPTLTVTKHVVNDDGGTSTAAAFTVTVTNNGTALPAFAGSESGVTLTLAPGSYSVTEVAAAGYDASASASCTGTIAAGESRSCTITNNDIAPRLTVIKHVVNDSGGNKTAGDFTITVTSNGTALAPFAGSETGTALTLKAGTYAVTEAAVAGYASAFSADCSGTLAVGDAKTCTVTNDDQITTGQLTVIKHVVNDNGGARTSADFTITVTSNGAALPAFAGSETGVVRTLTPGPYSVAEATAAGYAMSLSAECAGTIAAGQSRTCTITNDDIAPQLTVIKHVINNDGGTKTAADFTITVTNNGTALASFAGDEGGTTRVLTAGAYSVAETALAGYAGTMSADCAGSISVGQSKTCTITNDDQVTTGRLTVIKHVVNDNGGTNVASDFTITVTSNGSALASFAGSESGTQRTLSPGTYSVGETGPFGYTATLSADCAGTIAAGQSRICTITNDDQPAHLTVIKHVVNDNGGTNVASDFTITVTGSAPLPASFAGSETGTVVTMNAGAYSVDEASIAGYEKSLSSGCSGSFAIGQTATCTITNDDIPPAAPQLTVIKHVVNNNGGTRLASDFTITITNNAAALASFAGSETGTVRTLAAGSYSVAETATAGYGATLSSDCAGTIAAGEAKTCTITNDDQPAHLTVIKHVINDNGGTLTAPVFVITVTSNGTALPTITGSEIGTAITLNAGAYTVTEAAVAGYAATTSTDCSGTLALGEVKTCTITNNDVAPVLTVIKHVVNDNGGTKTAADFTITVTNNGTAGAPFAGAETPGTAVTLNAGTYSVAEAAVAGYAATMSADCSGTIAIGQSKSCTITNDDQRAQLTVVKHVVSDNGGNAIASDWTMNVTGNAPSQATFAGSEAGTTITIGAGSYGVDESGGPSGYAKTLSAACSGTIAAGESRTCTITNDDQPAHLTVIKHVVNDNGGTRVASDFTLTVTGGAVSLSTCPGAESPGTTVTLNAGPYSADEAAVTGYAKTRGATCSGSLAPGESRTCTITNDDIAPQLFVFKNVVNDNGGTLTPADFTIGVTGSGVSLPSFPGSAAGTLVTLNAGAYSVDEGAVAGYAKTLGVSCSGTLAVGDSRTCFVTNDDIGPILTVIKHVVNDNGGTKTAADFNIVVTNNGTARVPFAGAETPGTILTLSAGTYSVDEAAASGYTKTVSAGCSGTFALGGSATCTITNDDVVVPPAPQLTVVKHVVNDSGGTRTAADFTITITNNGSALASFAGSETGTTRTLAAGSYSVAEAAVTGYASTLSPDCSGTLVAGDTKTCTITNDDRPARLTVIKHVVNDNGGTKVASDFALSVVSNGTTVATFAGAEAPGVTVTVDAGTVFVDEALPGGYSMRQSAECGGTLALGESRTCTVTNDDLPPGQLIVRKVLVNDNGGTAAPSDWSFTVTGTSPSPATFAGSASGTTVTLGTGPYRVDESPGPGGYNRSASADCVGSMGPGETKTCTFTNDDIAPVLFVFKHVVNDNGGVKVAADFTITVTGNSPSPASFPGSEGGQLVTLNAGAYSVDEAAMAGYRKSLSAGCTGTLTIGGGGSCVITNDDIGGDAQLTVIKHVVNDNGGTKTAANFTMTVTGNSPSPASFPGSETGTVVGINSGTYAVDELPTSGYSKSIGPDCFGTIAPGETKTCTITNDDIASGTTFTVNSFLDGADDSIDGVCFSTVGAGCTLRAAIQEANAHAGPDTVVLRAGTYTLTIRGSGELAGATGDLNITEDLTIVGAGSATTTVAGGAGWDDRLVSVPPSALPVQNVSISGVTLMGGHADENGGGALLANHGFLHLFLSDVRVQGNNSVGPGGGIRFGGEDLTATDLVISANFASLGTAGLPAPGGGLNANVAVVHLDRITVTGNTSAGGNGGMALAATVGTVDHLSVTNNETRFGDQGGAAIVGQIAVRNATIAQNRAPDNGVGGILLQSGASLRDSLVDSNQATLIGGIGLQSSGGLERVRITNNSVTAFASGVETFGSNGEHLTDVTISGNAMPAGSGSASAAVYLNNFGDPNVLTNVTISGNQDSGILNGGGVILTNVTISGNRDWAIQQSGGSLERLTNVTIASNGFGLVVSGGGVSARNVIVANNTGGNWTCSFGAVTSLGHNLDSGAPVDGCGFGGGPGDQINTDPMLGPLANNGGFTQTHALLVGSPAIDRGDPDTTTCPATDQRGVTRPRDGDGNGSTVCDIGAFERQSPTVP